MHLQRKIRSKPLRRLILGAITACLIILSPVAQAYGDDAASGAAAPVSREYMIKAAILYNLVKFARWPRAAFDHDESPFRLCVLGDDPFGLALASIDGKRVNDRRLQTTIIADTAEARRCHMVFVSASEQAQIKPLLAAIGTQPILTIADQPGFARAGGMINLKTVDNRSRFDVNIGAAKRAGLELSAKLLRLATTVIKS